MKSPRRTAIPRHRATQLTVAQVGEAGLLAVLRRWLGVRRPGVPVPVGDDAAVLDAVAPHAVLTTDMLIEHVDFELAWASWADVGHKAAAVNVSDLAGMGAEPRALLLSLALRPSDRVADVLALVRAVARAGARYGAPLVGGDLSRIDGPLVVSVTAVGRVGEDEVLRRYHGRPGDVVAVSGRLGGAAAGLHCLVHEERAPARLTRRLLRPEPRVALGRALVRAGVARSGADISDGLASDALHVAGAGCGVELDVRALPIEPGVAAVAERMGRAPWQLALAGGEDFELVVAVPRKTWARAQRLASRLRVPLTAVGRVVRRPGLHLVGDSGAAGLRGFDHFAPR